MLDPKNTPSIRIGNNGEEQLHAQTPNLSSSLPNLALQVDFDTRSRAEALPSPNGSRPSIPRSGSKLLGSRKSVVGQDTRRGKSQSVFQALEDYIIGCFRHCDCLNRSFSFPKPAAPTRSVSEGTVTALHQGDQAPELRAYEEDVFALDAKILLLGDVAENGSTCPISLLQRRRTTNPTV